MTMRLNDVVVCPVCERQVNPFIVKDAAGYADKQASCPCCSSEFVLHCTGVEHSKDAADFHVITAKWEGVRESSSA
jgi:hypothetical protein